MTKITMKEAKMPLLTTLFAMGEADPHPCEKVIRQAAATVLGDSVPAPNTPEWRVVYAAFGNAAFYLRKVGALESVGRCWKLLPLGAQVASGAIPLPARDRAAERAAKTSSGSESTEPERVDAPSEDSEAPPSSAPSPREEPVRRRLKVATVVSAAPSPVADETSLIPPLEWIDDANVRALVAYNTGCYTAWAPESSECGRCPLAGDCRSSLSVFMADFSTRLRQLAVTPGVTALHQEAQVLLNPASVRDVAELRGGVPYTTPFDVVCAETNEKIPSGTVAYYVRGRGPVSREAYEAGVGA
jgi:hypothetical protein